jgi:hypothetical protein
MSRIRRPSAALVVAFIALLVALGGSAGADPVGFVAKTIKGKSIKKGSVTGDRLKRNTITGRQVRESSLAEVPKAAAADSAASAGTAQTAGSAGSATTAGSALTAGSADLAKALDGHQRMATRRAAPTAGATEAAARDAAPRVVLGASGPFTIYGKCFRDQATSSTHAEAFIETTVDQVVYGGNGSSYAGPDFLTPATPEIDRLITSKAVTGDDARLDAFPFVAIPPTGPTLGGVVSVGVRQGNAGTGGAFGDGDACLFVGLTEAG